jgi:hypothetical protein
MIVKTRGANRRKCEHCNKTARHTWCETQKDYCRDHFIRLLDSLKVPADSIYRRGL